MWHKSSWRRLPLTHRRAGRTDTGLGKQTLGGHKQNLVHTRTQEKGAVAPQEADPDLPMRVQESRGGMGQQWSASGLGAQRIFIYNGILLSHESNEFEAILVRW